MCVRRRSDLTTPTLSAGPADSSLNFDGSQHADSAYDDKRDAILIALGYRVLRFWNADVWVQSTMCARRLSPQSQVGWRRSSVSSGRRQKAALPLIRPGCARPPSPARGEGRVIRLQPRFAELAAMTNFSFLRGASHPEEMVKRAVELGLAGIGIADRNTLAGVVRAHVFARENAAAMGATRVVPGARLAFDDGAPDVLAYPKNRAAYGRLCRILTAGNLRAPKGECRLRLDDLVELGEGLQVIVMPPLSPWGEGLGRRGRGGLLSATPREKGCQTESADGLPPARPPPQGEGARAPRPPARSLRPAPVDRREFDLWRAHARGTRAACGACAPGRLAADRDQ